MKAGFTLIELLVVIGIMIVLGGIIMGAVAAAAKYSEQSATKAELQTLCAALEAYRTDQGVYPNDGTDGHGVLRLFSALDQTYYKFGSEEVYRGPSGPAITDHSGYLFSYDRTWNEISDVSEALTQVQPSGYPIMSEVRGAGASFAPRNIRGYDIWTFGVNGPSAVSRGDFVRNW